MTLLELAVYGIRNFKQLRRLAFRAGMNLVHGRSGAGKTSLAQALAALLEPSDDVVRATLGNGGDGPCQYGMVYRTADGAVFRFIRDLGRRKVHLSQRDGAGTFQVAAADPDSAFKTITSHFKGFRFLDLNLFFNLSRGLMPSSRPPAWPTAVESAPVAAGFDAVTTVAPQPAPAAVAAPIDREAKTKRLAEIKQQLARADALGKIEDQVADTQAKLAERRRLQRTVSERRAALDGQNMNHPIAKLALPADLDSRLHEVETQESVRNERLAGFEEELDTLTVDISTVRERPFYQNRLLQAGAGVIVVALVVALFVPMPTLGRNLFLLAFLAGAGMAGYALWTDAAAAGNRAKLVARQRDLTRQRDAFLSQYRREHSAIYKLIEGAGAKDVETFREQLRDYRAQLAAAAERRQEVERLLGGRTPEALQEEVETLARNLTELEERLRHETALAQDTYTLEEEARRLEAELNQVDLGATQVGAVIANGGGFIGQSEDGGGRSEGGGIPADSRSLHPPVPPGATLLSPTVAERFANHPLRGRLADARPALRAKLQELITALGCDLTAELDDRLEVTWVRPNTGPVAFETFSSGQQDLLYLAWFLAVAETLDPQSDFPLILDDPLTALDDDGLKKALDILARFAQNRQILLFAQTRYAVPGDPLVVTLP